MIEAVLLPLWPVLAGAFGLGLPFGVLGWREQPAGFFGRLGLILAVLGLVGGAALAASGSVPGRPALWVEIGLACAAAYVVGCVLGSLARSVFNRLRSRPERAAPAA
jgi:hypothetical protein